MLTNNKIKLIKSLDQKKVRKESGCFVIEGEKMVRELLQSRFETMEVFAVQSYIDELPSALTKNVEISVVSEKDLERLTHLKTANKAIALARIPDKDDDSACPQNGISIALENIQDPGNMGTIIRTADWFGIRDIYCAPGTADCFSPKVVQATMSALGRVRMHYFKSRDNYLQWLDNNDPMPLYGTFLEGENIYQKKLVAKGLLIMGNEGRGISEEVAQRVNEKILIPAFAEEHVESLNVGIATAICLSEILRR